MRLMPSLHTLREISLAAMWLIQNRQQYAPVGYLLLEYVTGIALAHLPEAERARIQAHLQRAGLATEVARAGPLAVLSALSHASPSSSTGVLGMLLAQGSAATRPPLVEATMQLLKPHLMSNSTLYAHVEEALNAYLSQPRGGGGEASHHPHYDGAAAAGASSAAPNGTTTTKRS
jgi:hypothetical protein